MDNLTSMLQTPTEVKETTGAEIAAPISKSPEPTYPYGLEISLNQDSLKKLGIDITSMSIGDTADLEAKVKVTRISMNQGYDGNNSQSLDLQITDMALTSEPADFQGSFDEAIAKDKKIYPDLQTQTAGGFKKSLYEATR